MSRSEVTRYISRCGTEKGPRFCIVPCGLDMKDGRGAVVRQPEASEARHLYTDLRNNKSAC
jgi:hypothetical protein